MFPSKKPLPTPLPDVIQEVTKCDLSTEYFIRKYCQIDDKVSGSIFKFELWDSQVPIVKLMCTEDQLAVLKARQVGLTWLALCYALKKALFNENISVLLFSVRDDEATELLARLKRVYDRLPNWLKCTPRNTNADNAHNFELSNGSNFKAFPTGRGDSYTASLVICDEFDILDEEQQHSMLKAVKPTVDAGGQLFLISKADKKKPLSLFKSIYNTAKTGRDKWKCAFIPWYAVPGRTQNWYDEEKRSLFKQTRSNDTLYENYPESDLQALEPSSSDKRLPAEWIRGIFEEVSPIPTPGGLAHINGLVVYKQPEFGRRYCGGGDSSEGNPNSDPASLVLLDKITGEEVLSINERLSPSRLAECAALISIVYPGTSWLIERNNHGHAVIMWLNNSENYKNLGIQVRVLSGDDGNDGWATSGKSKTILYDYASDCIRDRQCIIHTNAIAVQLQHIEGTKLNAPEPMHDDYAMAYVLALMACKLDQGGCKFKPEDFAVMTRGRSGQVFGTDGVAAGSGVFGMGGSPGDRRRTIDRR